MATEIREDELRISRPVGPAVQWALIDPQKRDRDDNPQPPSFSWVMERNLEAVLRKGAQWPTRQDFADAIEKFPHMAKSIREFLEAENTQAFQEVDILQAPVTYRCQLCGMEAKSAFGLKSHQRAKHKGLAE
jgi:hypothetical protein